MRRCIEEAGFAVVGEEAYLDQNGRTGGVLERIKAGSFEAAVGIAKFDEAVVDSVGKGQVSGVPFITDARFADFAAISGGVSGCR